MSVPTDTTYTTPAVVTVRSYACRSFVLILFVAARRHDNDDVCAASLAADVWWRRDAPTSLAAEAAACRRVCRAGDNGIMKAGCQPTKRHYRA